MSPAPLSKTEAKLKDAPKDSETSTVPIKKAGTPIPDAVYVHPLVLLSVVDNYARVAHDTRKRVVGVLLGERHGATVHVRNSFAGWC